MLAIIAITERGRTTAKKISSGLPGKSRLYFPSRGTLKELVGEVFDKDRFEGIIFIMALGIVVRLIAPYLKDKFLDPAVVAVDEGESFAISVVSGHEGGANRLAIEVGNILTAGPVITTASEVRKKIIIGMGCRRGIKKEEIVKGIKYALAKTKSSLNEVKYIATIDLKKDEAGLIKACSELGLPLRFITMDLVREFGGSYHRSAFVKEKIGIEGVCEPCALLSGRRTKLILSRTILKGLTVAAAREN